MIGDSTDGFGPDKDGPKDEAGFPIGIRGFVEIAAGNRITFVAELLKSPNPDGSRAYVALLPSAVIERGTVHLEFRPALATVRLVASDA